MNPLADDEPLENGYGSDTLPGDNLFNDFIRGEAVSAVVLSEARGERTYRDPGRLAMADGASPMPFSNLVVIERPPRNDIDELIAEIRAFFGGNPGGPCLLKSLFPLPDLTPFGGTLIGHPPVMMRAPAPLPAPPAGIDLVRVTDERTSRDFEETLVLGFPVPQLQPFRAGCYIPSGSLDAPGWQHFVGYADGRPVAAGSSFTDSQLLRVENIAVMADARGRGFGAAITVATMGANPNIPATLVASDPGRPVYERLGFRALHRATYWLVPR
jgi:GNAT superfamily N-acetyltransferase